MDTTDPATGSNARSFLEAGFFGFAVIFAVAAAMLLAIPLGMSITAGKFEPGSFALGGMALAMSGSFWSLSRVARWR